MKEVNVISLTRGDTLKFKFQRLNVVGEPIIAPADRVYFTVKKNAGDAAFILQKTLNDMTLDEMGYYHVTVEPADTDPLKFGNYVYDIEVITDSYKQTISIGSFVVNKEVTYARNEVQ